MNKDIPGLPVVKWLLEDNIIPVKYRTLVDLLDRKAEDPEVRELKIKLPGCKEVKKILERMEPGGYWLQKNHRTGEVLGDGTPYGAFATTHFCLAYLAELGMDRSHPAIALAADRYLDLQKPDGDFWDHLSCLMGYNIRTFILLGYKKDKRLRKAIDLMLKTERPDGGYLCDTHDKKSVKRRRKSCVRGCVKMLLAFAELPDLWNHPRCLELVDYFLSREGIFKKRDPSQVVNKDMITSSFPITWRADAVQVLYGLSRMGYGRRKELKRAWKQLENKSDGEGKYVLDWNPKQAPLNPGKRGMVNKWVTLYSLIAQKYR